MSRTSTPGTNPEPEWRRLDAALRGFYAPRVADPQVRADLVQDVLLRMHERREQLRADDRLDAWAFRIARNVLVDHYRSARPMDALPELSEAPPEPESDAPRVLGAWLRQRIHTLPDPYREALELTELRGLSQREAAAQLDLPYSTLKSRVQRGRDQLHAQLLQCCAIERDVRGRVTDYRPRSCAPCGCQGEDGSPEPPPKK